MRFPADICTEYLHFGQEFVNNVDLDEFFLLKNCIITANSMAADNWTKKNNLDNIKQVCQCNELRLKNSFELHHAWLVAINLLLFLLILNFFVHKFTIAFVNLNLKLSPERTSWQALRRVCQKRKDEFPAELSNWNHLLESTVSLYYFNKDCWWKAAGFVKAAWG